MAKGNPNIAEYGKNTRFGSERGCSAVEAGRKGNEAQAVAREVMGLIAGRLPQDEAAEVFVEKLLNGDLNAWRLWLEYNVAKPATKIEAEVEDRTLNVIINDGSDD